MKRQKKRQSSEDVVLQSLAAKIAAVKGQKEPDKAGEEAKAQSEAARVVADVALMPVASLVIGYALDRWFDTLPLLTMVFFVLGVIVGLYNLLRLDKTKQQ